MSDTVHKPVMVDEVLEFLAKAPPGWYIDATFGGGGHTEKILEHIGDDSKLLAIDRDPDAVTRGKRRFDGQSVRFERDNYGNIDWLVTDGLGEKASGLLIDAGLSSDQLEDKERSFSYQGNRPLDFRMGPDAMKAETFFESVAQSRFAEILRKYGDIRSAQKIASSILERHEDDEMRSTADLKEAIRAAIDTEGASGRLFALVFQAIRMAVNQELEALESVINNLPGVLKEGGRAVFISFHSGEDRIVKHGLRELENDCICPPDLPVCGCDETKYIKVLTSSPVTPTDEEKQQNPRARSAKLRAVEVIESLKI